MSIFTASQSRVKVYRETAIALSRVQSAVSSNFRSPRMAFEHGAAEFDDTERSRRQYEANRGAVATAIRPIVNLGGGQPFRVGYETLEGARSAKFSASAPDFMCKHLSDGRVEVDEDNPLIKLLNAPNERMSGYALKQVSLASMVLTGRVVWWIDSTGENREDYPELGPLRLWYIPRHWLRRMYEAGGQVWRIQPPGTDRSWEVTADQLFISTVPDPANPMMSFSSVQAQAASVDADDKILKAQAISLENHMRPNLVVTVGKIPGGAPPPGQRVASGQNGRPMLTADQREEIIDAFRQNLGGIERTHEPIILDALIESVTPYLPTPAELDMLNSQKVTNDRTMHGIGTSEIMAGQTQNANRAGAIVAEDIFYRVTVNPLLRALSEDLDKQLGPRFSVGDNRLRVWIDLLEVDDPDAIAARVRLAMPAMQLGELRKWLQTGKLELEDVDESVASQFMHTIVGRGAGEQSSRQQEAETP